MGMFDTILFKCPCCGKVLEKQNKAGACLLYEYEQEAVPIINCFDIHGETITCDNCFSKWVIDFAFSEPPNKWPMKLSPYKEEAPG